MLSIGAVSRETGIPVETLRTWERRYGFPCPERTPGGHRVYAPTTVDRLQLVSQALESGVRAAQAVPASEDELRGLIGRSRGNEPGDRSAFRPVNVTEPVAHWLRAARELDGEALDRGFRTEWNRIGAQRFLMERATPFMEAIGEYWSTGELGVLHEHFASERLRDFLAAAWRPISDQAPGPRVICTTLPEERHYLTLHMIATVVAMAGCRVVFLGADTPLFDIDTGARQADTAAVFISVSRAADPRRARPHLEALRQRLDADVPLVVGGAGAPTGLRGVLHMNDLGELDIWARRLVQQHRSN